jgi:hypothetical protein
MSKSENLKDEATATATPMSSRICGMRKKVFWILVTALLIIAIALGIGLGVGLSQDDDGNRYAISRLVSAPKPDSHQ